MSRNTFITTRFNCRLDCQRCEHIKANGVRCRNRVCFGTPLCWIHTRMTYGVQARDSTIPGAGKGLFATREFQQDDWIVPYVGEVVTDPCLNQRYGDDTAPYASEYSRRRFIDSACRRGTGARANGLFRADGRSRSINQHNAVILNRPGGNGGLWLRARRNIPMGSEIFVWYGDEYRVENNHETRRSTIADTRPC